jgi:hypothetical protein
MARYRWAGPHPHRDRRTGRVIEAGDIVDAERIVAAHPDKVERVDTDDGVTAAEGVVDPGAFSVAELRDHLADADYDEDDLDALAAAERDGDDRTTALDAIDAARP